MDLYLEDDSFRQFQLFVRHPQHFCGIFVCHLFPVSRIAGKQHFQFALGQRTKFSKTNSGHNPSVSPRQTLKIFTHLHFISYQAVFFQHVYAIHFAL